VPEREPVLDLVGAEWQTVLWPRFTGGGAARAHRQRVLDEILAHHERGRLTAALLALGARVVLDRVADAAPLPDGLTALLDALATADDATIDAWAADLDGLGRSSPSSP